MKNGAIPSRISGQPQGQAARVRTESIQARAISKRFGDILIYRTR